METDKGETERSSAAVGIEHDTGQRWAPGFVRGEHSSQQSESHHVRPPAAHKTRDHISFTYCRDSDVTVQPGFGIKGSLYIRCTGCSHKCSLAFEWVTSVLIKGVSCQERGAGREGKYIVQVLLYPHRNDVILDHSWQIQIINRIGFAISKNQYKFEIGVSSL